MSSAVGENEPEEDGINEPYEYDEEAGDHEGEEEDVDAMVNSKIQELEEESKKISALEKQVEGRVTASIDKEELDSRSVYIGNVCF